MELATRARGLASWLAGLACAILIGPAGMGAAAAGALAGACGLTPEAEPVRVAGVADNLELRLDDGRVALLAGIDPVRPTTLHPGFADDARRSLGAWLDGRTAFMTPLAAVPDRWNRTPALVFAPPPGAGAQPSAPVPGAAPALSVGEALIDAGWARARPDVALHPCFAQYLALESQARAAKLNLWSDPAYAILGPDDGPALDAAAGGMAVVEGPATSRADRARVVLSLGPAPSRFRATLARKAVRSFARAGIAIESVAGKRLRVRGFLDNRFGPTIDLRDPDQVEVLDP